MTKCANNKIFYKIDISDLVITSNFNSNRTNNLKYFLIINHFLTLI